MIGGGAGVVAVLLLEGDMRLCCNLSDVFGVNRLTIAQGGVETDITLHTQSIL